MSSQEYSLRFDDDDVSVDWRGMWAGWTFAQFGELSLFDEPATVEFPDAEWSDLHWQVATRVVQGHWQQHAATYLEQFLTPGSCRLATGDCLSADSQLFEHLMYRPLVSVDAAMRVKLSGQATSRGFNGRVSILMELNAYF